MHSVQDFFFSANFLFSSSTPPHPLCYHSLQKTILVENYNNPGKSINEESTYFIKTSINQ